MSSTPAQDLAEHSHQEAIRLVLDGETAWDRRLMAASYWLNPILVKETRQALKSQQFVWTFLLLITVVTCWTLMAVLSSIPNIYYDSNGTAFLLGYLMILLVPTMLVVPQATFRSMASELEDGTFETLSLSLLSPPQVVYGKLSIAILQLVIYLSILAPCIAMTYLLQGVTLELIAWLLLIISATCIFLCAVAIFLASLSRTRMLQVLFSVVMIGLQLIAGGTLLSTIFGLMAQGSFAGAGGWIPPAIGVAFLIGYGWLFLRCASSAIGMASENRSTPIRRALFVIGMLIPIIGIFLLILYEGQRREEISPLTCVVAIFAWMHWGIAGSWMMGESGVITSRTRRTLPDSFFQRLFLTWFNPGAGPGYLFVVLSFAGPWIAFFGVFWLVRQLLGVVTMVEIDEEVFLYCSALAAYLALYLGTVRLMILGFFGNARSSRMMLSFALVFVMLILSVLVSCSVSLAAGDYRDMEYDWYCFINPFWTLSELFPVFNVNGTPWALSSHPWIGAWAILMLVAGVVFSLNALLTARDVMITRIETPQRILEEYPRKKLEQETVDL